MLFWVIYQGKPGSQIKTEMQMKGALSCDELSAAVDKQFPAETSVERILTADQTAFCIQLLLRW